MRRRDEQTEARKDLSRLQTSVRVAKEMGTLPGLGYLLNDGGE